MIRPAHGLGKLKRWLGCVVIAMFLTMSLSAKKHPVVFAEYALEYQGGEWILSFTQKTSYLRDAIYATRPELKGINLNSDQFLQATSNHVKSNIGLRYRNDALILYPRYMKYGGLKFESSFVVEGLTKKPEHLGIVTGGYDVHEHSIIIFQITEGSGGFMNYFNRNDKAATFDFEKSQFVMGEFDYKSYHQLTNYFLLFTGLLVVLVFIIKFKGPQKASI